MWNMKTNAENEIKGRFVKVMFGALMAVLLGSTSPQQTQAQLPSTTSTTVSSPAPDPSVAKENSSTFPSSFTPTNPCTGESVVVNGQSHVLTQNQASSNGNTRMRMVFHDFGTGLAMMTGAKYEFSDTNETILETKSNESGPSDLTFQFNAHLVRQAETTNTTGMNGGGDDWFTYSQVTFQFSGHAPSGMKLGQNRTECR